MPPEISFEKSSPSQKWSFRPQGDMRPKTDNSNDMHVPGSNVTTLRVYPIIYCIN